MKHYGQEKDGSPVDAAIEGAVTPLLKKYLADHNPKTADSKPVFKFLGAPAAAEIKVQAVDKGVGLKTIVEYASEQGVTPSAIIFAGDDICKGKSDVIPGTDYFAFKAGPDIAKGLKIPFYKIHTLHPENGELPVLGTEPSLSIPSSEKMIRPMSDRMTYPGTIEVDVTTNSPLSTGQIVKDTLEAVRSRLEHKRVNTASQAGPQL